MRALGDRAGVWFFLAYREWPHTERWIDILSGRVVTIHRLRPVR